MCCHSNPASLRAKGRVLQIHLLHLQIDFLETESCVLIIKMEPVIFIKTTATTTKTHCSLKLICLAFTLVQFNVFLSQKGGIW